ncbi:DMT family transporter [Priestia flexa]|jgi:bacterial/archaeal transporter family-2 protein|uniref:DMT family transporter n=1 Tax=Priestia flexa TaxID=86664 RepID=A0A8I1SMK5_9BACI|nr:DMT family transporter [Priestia flexa]MBN8252872.1 DMT family transporter [Priestia flexa]MBN8435293.1 DMT family transporter [Priestia flexa]MCA0967793.1 DMT family transporter [Priestia flexa]MCG7315047.1 DMT family transporter [Priestia flexa]MDW8517501.1 DMT family transporter [Priestia flexa]
MSFILLIAAVIGGVLLSAQSSVNGALSRKAGTYESAFLTFATGTLVLFLLILFFGKGDVLALLDAPKWQLSAVWFGVSYLFLTVLAVPQIGVIAANISTVIGQLSAGIIIDHFGFFGGAQISLDWKRGLAIVLMLIALRLIYVGNKKSVEKSTSKAA